MTPILYKAITLWQNQTFPAATALSKCHHLKEEVNELFVEVEQNNQQNAKKELADCFILLFGIADKLGLTYQQLVEIIYEKQQININRKWGNPDENGVVKHVADSLKEHTKNNGLTAEDFWNSQPPMKNIPDALNEFFELKMKERVFVSVHGEGRDKSAFLEFCKPLMKYLCENYNPHVKVIIDGTRAEIVQGLKTVKCDDFIID